jgi:hypothetical protein
VEAGFHISIIESHQRAIRSFITDRHIDIINLQRTVATTTGLFFRCDFYRANNVCFVLQNAACRRSLLARSRIRQNRQIRNNR